MSSELESFCFLGVPNSQVFLSDKDLNDMEFNLLVRSSLEDHEELQEGDQEEDKEKRRRVSQPLKIEIPSYEEKDDDDEENEGFKTPTSAIHRISEILQCPPAPRKPKSIPSTKRKASRPRFLLDLSKEIESLFPRPIVLDLGGEIKKAKKAM